MLIFQWFLPYMWLFCSWVHCFLLSCWYCFHATMKVIYCKYQKRGLLVFWKFPALALLITSHQYLKPTKFQCRFQWNCSYEKICLQEHSSLSFNLNIHFYILMFHVWPIAVRLYGFEQKRLFSKLSQVSDLSLGLLLTSPHMFPAYFVILPCK